LQCVAICCSALECVAGCYRVLQCVAVCYSALQCVAVCCSVLQCVAVCCSVLQCYLGLNWPSITTPISECVTFISVRDFRDLPHTATRCNMLQHALHVPSHEQDTRRERPYTSHTSRTLQHTATHRNTLQHAATRCNTPYTCHPMSKTRDERDHTHHTLQGPSPIECVR